MLVPQHNGFLPIAHYLCGMIIAKIKRRLRWASMQKTFALGKGAGLLRDRPGLRILNYHGVVPPPLRRIHARFVTTPQFEEHIVYLKTHFQVISLDQAFAGEYDSGRMAVALTFDDGYRNNLEHALPILQKHALPATFFVSAPQAFGGDILWADLLDITTATTDGKLQVLDRVFKKNGKGEFVGADGIRLKECCKLEGPYFIQSLVQSLDKQPFRDDPSWDDYWKLMDANALKALAAAPGISIGSHGTQHYNLDQMPLVSAMIDVRAGIFWVEKAIGKKVKAFAYPDGAYTPAMVDAVAKIGIAQQLLSEYRYEDQADGRVRDRFAVHPFLPTKVLMAEMLRGGYF